MTLGGGPFRDCDSHLHWLLSPEPPKSLCVLSEFSAPAAESLLETDTSLLHKARLAS